LCRTPIANHSRWECTAHEQCWSLCKTCTDALVANVKVNGEAVIAKEPVRDAGIDIKDNGLYVFGVEQCRCYTAALAMLAERPHTAVLLGPPRDQASRDQALREFHFYAKRLNLATPHTSPRVYWRGECLGGASELSQWLKTPEAKEAKAQEAKEAKPKEAKEAKAKEAKEAKEVQQVQATLRI
jgi:hypothetical protein